MISAEIRFQIMGQYLVAYEVQKMKIKQIVEPTELSAWLYSGNINASISRKPWIKYVRLDIMWNASTYTYSVHAIWRSNIVPFR